MTAHVDCLLPGIATLHDLHIVVCIISHVIVDVVEGVVVMTIIEVIAEVIVFIVVNVVIYILQSAIGLFKSRTNL